MKGIKTIIILAILALFAVSWYNLFDNSVKQQEKYDGYMEMARKKAQMGIVTDAEQNYMAAYDMHESLELRCEIAEFYSKAGLSMEFEEWCETITSAYPHREEGYVFLAEYYKGFEEYKECFSVISKAKKRKIESAKLDKMDQELAYLYSLSFSSFEEAGNFFAGFCPVMNREGLWGYMSEQGNQDISYMYQEVREFMSSGYAPVMSTAEEFFLINANGDKKFVDVDKKRIEDCGPLSEDRMAVKINGSYSYADKEFKILFGDYDYAGTFNGGLAAVRSGEDWMMVDKTGKQVWGKKFKDIKQDPVGMAVRKGYLFAEDNGKYRMLDMNGQPVSDNTWEDAKNFSYDEWTCVKQNGKWGYIDIQGNVVIEPQYEDAKPFSNGMAAVKVKGRWGFINKNKELVIPAEFEDAGEFTASASTFVRTLEGWKFLRIFRGSIL